MKRIVGFIGPIIEVHATRKLALTLLDTYVGPRSGKRVMSGQIHRGDGEEINAALWFCDLRNYTALSEQYNKDEVFDLLNNYFETVSRIVTDRGGEILKFVGDAILVVFPVDKQNTAAKACSAALAAAKESFGKFEKLNSERSSEKKPEIQFGIGLHFGNVIYGNVGAIDRLDFTVIGPAVNLTARLEALTKHINYPLLMSEDFSKHVETETQFVGNFALKGIQNEQSVYALPGT